MLGAVKTLPFCQSRPAFLKPMRFQFDILKLIKQVILYQVSFFHAFRNSFIGDFCREEENWTGKLSSQLKPGVLDFSMQQQIFPARL